MAYAEILGVYDEVKTTQSVNSWCFRNMKFNYGWSAHGKLTYLLSADLRHLLGPLVQRSNLDGKIWGRV